MSRDGGGGVTKQRNLLLAIDTATAVTGVALFDGSLVSELTWRCGQNQTAELLPAAVWLLEQQGWTSDDVDAVAVSLGPGSFNGLRVGLSAAKALAFARGLPCLGVGTLAATAFQYLVVERAIRPLYDAGRGEAATALYRRDGDEIRQLEGPRLTTVAALAAEIDQPTLICGEVHARWMDLLIEHVGDLVSFPPQAGMVRRPGYLAELGWRRWQASERDDVVSLQPIYLRRPAITPAKR